MPQISWPEGLVTHMEEKVWGQPGVNIPEWSVPGWVTKKLYPLDMVARGYVYIREEQAKSLKVGDAIQVDRWHCTVASIGRAEEVTDIGCDPHETVRARKVVIKREQWI